MKENIEELIQNALKKLESNRESDICRYLPVNGGYMHHFTFRKMRQQLPEELSEMIDKYVMKPKYPANVPPRARAPRGSRKGDHLSLDDDDIKRILSIARLANDQDIIRKLTPARSLPQIKKKLITAIRQGKVDEELWRSYADAATTSSSTKETAKSGSSEGPTGAWKTLSE